MFAIYLNVGYIGYVHGITSNTVIHLYCWLIKYPNYCSCDTPIITDELWSQRDHKIKRSDITLQQPSAIELNDHPSRPKNNYQKLNYYRQYILFCLLSFLAIFLYRSNRTTQNWIALP